MGKTMGLKPLSDPEVQGMSDADLTALITNGKGKMPAMKGKITDDTDRRLCEVHPFTEVVIPDFCDEVRRQRVSCRRFFRAFGTQRLFQGWWLLAVAKLPPRVTGGEEENCDPEQQHGAVRDKRTARHR